MLFIAGLLVGIVCAAVVFICYLETFKRPDSTEYSYVRWERQGDRLWVPRGDDFVIDVEAVNRRKFDEESSVDGYPRSVPECPHGDDPTECDACFRESDFQYDAWRETR